MANKLADLTEDKNLKAEFQKIDELLANEENKEKFSKMTTPEEVFAFFEENGYTYTDEMKEKIMKFADQHKNEELSEDDLAEVAGGWGWYEFGCGAVGGGFTGTLLGVLAATALASNPVGWVIGGCALGAVSIGAATAVIDG